MLDKERTIKPSLKYQHPYQNQLHVVQIYVHNTRDSKCHRRVRRLDLSSLMNDGMLHSWSNVCAKVCPWRSFVRLRKPGSHNVSTRDRRCFLFQFAVLRQCWKIVFMLSHLFLSWGKFIIITNKSKFWLQDSR